jgi:hypothetical protein
VKWKNNKIDDSYLKPYLKEFGTTFYAQIKRLIDQAMVKELDREKLKLEAYQILLGKHVKHHPDKSRFVEFKDLIGELVTHANEYNEINSKFFGRDHFMLKVIFLLKSEKTSLFYNQPFLSYDKHPLFIRYSTLLNPMSFN